MFTDMLGIAWSVLQWVVSYIWILCIGIFCGVTVWTIIEKAGQLAKAGAPGWNKILGKLKG